MKTLILYASKYGAAREIANRLSRRLDDSVIHDLKQGAVSALTEFDCVIIGSSLYAGTIRKEIKVFLKQNADSLKGKKIGLFLSGMQSDINEINKAFDFNFPIELLQVAAVKEFLGGIFDPEKARGMDRFLFKAITKQSEYSSTIDEAKIQKFTEDLLK